MALALSTEPVVAKVQQDPHAPWSLMGVVIPASTQLTEAGTEAFTSLEGGALQYAFEDSGLSFSPSILFISSAFQSENLL